MAEQEQEKTQEETPKDEKDLAVLDKIKLFNRWSFSDVEVDDMSLGPYININPVIIPHTGGHHFRKRFWKTEKISIVERFVNRMLAPGLLTRHIKGRGSSLIMGKKQKILKIVYNAFSIIEAQVNKNPIQVLVDAIINAAPREETTRISMGGVSYQQAVDIAPQRRIDLAVRYIVQVVAGQSYNNILTIDEILAKELILAAKNDVSSQIISKKDEIERIAVGAR